MKKKILLLSVFFIVVIAVSFFLIHKARVRERPSIGVICDLTGAVAEYGKWVQDGITLALDEIAKEDPSFRIHFEDGQTSMEKALNAFERFTSIDNIHLMIGGCNSSSIMSLAPKANATKTLLFSTIASSPNMTQAGDFVFSNRVLGIMEVEAIVKRLNEFGIKTVSVVAHNNEAGMPYIEAFNKAVQNEGITVVSEVLVDPNSNDFRTELIKLKSLRPDAVFLVTPVDQTLNFLKQSKTIDFSTKWLGISTLKTDYFIKNGGDLVEDVIIASEGVDDENLMFSCFQEKYQMRFGESPTIYSVNGYDATMILFTLTKKYGQDVLAIQKALYSDQFDTLSGKISFDENGIIENKTVNLFRISNGAFVKVE